MYCSECGSAISDSFKFCPVCGHAVLVSSSAPNDTTSRTAPSREHTAPDDRGGGKYYLIGVVVLASFCGLTTLVGLLHGLTILDLLEAAGWGCAAWYWWRRKPRHPAATVGVSLLGIAVIAGEIWFYRASHAPPRVFDLDAYLSSTTFTPPDTSGIKPRERAASCQEAVRLATACQAHHFTPSFEAGLGGYLVHLPSLDAVPQGLQLAPNKKDCETAFQWKNYCERN